MRLETSEVKTEANGGTLRFETSEVSLLFFSRQVTASQTRSFGLSPTPRVSQISLFPAEDDVTLLNTHPRVCTATQSAHTPIPWPKQLPRRPDFAAVVGRGY